MNKKVWKLLQSNFRKTQRDLFKLDKAEWAKYITKNASHYTAVDRIIFNNDNFVSTRYKLGQVHKDATNTWMWRHDKCNYCAFIPRPIRKLPA